MFSPSAFTAQNQVTLVSYELFSLDKTDNEYNYESLIFRIDFTRHT